MSNPLTKPYSVEARANPYLLQFKEGRGKPYVSTVEINPVTSPSVLMAIFQANLG